MPSNALRSFVLAAATIATALSSARADETKTDQGANDRLMIVSANSHRVIYDDGRDDLFCVTRRYVAGYNDYGYVIHRRTMRCR